VLVMIGTGGVGDFDGKGRALRLLVDDVCHLLRALAYVNRLMTLCPPALGAQGFRI
jgi:hypothetical protein